MTRTELLAIAKPIPFNTFMVQAIQENRKTETRRVIKPHYRADEFGFQVVINANTGEFVRVEKIDENECGIFSDGTERYVNPPYQPGDILYVRETWCNRPVTSGGHFRINGTYYYKADGDLRPDAWRGNWRPPNHMPKEAARLFLRVTGVSVEQVRDITDIGAINEGTLLYEGWKTKEYLKAVETAKKRNWKLPLGKTPIERFAHLWDSTIKPAKRLQYGWDVNPWVWVIKFERVVPE